VHSHYTRSLADLPCQGRIATVQVQARRFRCANTDCPRRIFTKRLPEVVRPWARRSERLADVQRHLGLALGGAAGARLADRLAMPISGARLLRLVVARTALPTPPQPRVVGIDEYAKRRGLTYGTILCDLERQQVIDLLPDRDAATVAAWLKQHPSVQVIARDRASVFGRAIRDGAPSRLRTAGISCAISAMPSVPRSVAIAKRSQQRRPRSSATAQRRLRHHGSLEPQARRLMPFAGNAVSSGAHAMRRCSACTKKACRLG
jgi:transposase